MKTAEHIIERKPLLIAEDGWDITDDGINRWKIVRPAEWERKDDYWAIEEIVEENKTEE